MEHNTYHATWEIDPERGLSVDCFVTDEGRRFLSLRGTQRLMGITERGGVTALAKTLSAEWMNPFMTEQLSRWVEDARERKIKSVSVNYGNVRSVIPFDAELFVDVCNVYIRAQASGLFNDPQFSTQLRISEQLAVVVTAFAKVGITALIDELTGYQDVRERDELQKILAKYVRAEYLPWTQRFPHEFYKQMFRLRGWKYDGKNRPGFAGRLTNYLVYERLPTGVLEKLQEINPVEENTGKRRRKHHQYLTEDTGIPHLDKHLSQVIALMRGFDDNEWDRFDRSFMRSFDVPAQVKFELDDDE